MTGIIDNLFVGDQSDAQAGFDGLIISVIDEEPVEDLPDTIWMPYLSRGIGALDDIASTIEQALAHGRRVLVHCGSGSERAPLAVAWFLNSRREFSLDAAYKLLMRRRPIVRDRRAWLRDHLAR